MSVPRTVRGDKRYMKENLDREAQFKARGESMEDNMRHRSFADALTGHARKDECGGRAEKVFQFLQGHQEASRHGISFCDKIFGRLNRVKMLVALPGDKPCPKMVKVGEGHEDFMDGSKPEMVKESYGSKADVGGSQLRREKLENGDTMEREIKVWVKAKGRKAVREKVKNAERCNLSWIKERALTLEA
ncbi:hypothetical protein Ddye_011823 [Dipteronia dyeriana]|uniref:Uncharacterized protein n=1 Tax=Dipteronia dyeriana TaxID=168575 RepID=A0AAD9X3D3_9ROSI|nr:hypothetical protein Ddye_011823 [Dipteronia dyeriana]